MSDCELLNLFELGWVMPSDITWGFAAYTMKACKTHSSSRCGYTCVTCGSLFIAMGNERRQNSVARWQDEGCCPVCHNDPLTAMIKEMIDDE